jgi:hypothetical protein
MDHYGWSSWNSAQYGDDRPAKRVRLSEANREIFDRGFSSPSQETLASWQPRAASPASSFGSVDSGLSHPPRANTGAKKVVGASFSQLYDQAHTDGPYDFYRFMPHAPRFPKLGQLVGQWKALLEPAAQYWTEHEKTLNELRGQFARARVQFRREEAARIWNKLVHATLNWHEYAADFVRLQNRIETLERFISATPPWGYFSFPCPWKNRPGCSHHIPAMTEDQHL